MASATIQTTTVLIDGYPVDAVVHEEHSWESDVSEFPVEKGSNIVDNVRNKPIRITLEGIVSNAPIGAVANVRSKVTPPADEAYAKLLKIHDDREPITLTTSLDTWENMVLEELTVPRDPGQGDYLRFSAKFVRVEIVSNTRAKRVAIPIAKSGGDKNRTINATPKKPPASDPAALARIIKIRESYASNSGGPVSWIWFDDDIGGWRHKVFIRHITVGDLAAAGPGGPLVGFITDTAVGSRAGWGQYDFYTVAKGQPFGSSLDAWNANRADSYWKGVIQQAYAAQRGGADNAYDPYDAAGVDVLGEKLVRVIRGA